MYFIQEKMVDIGAPAVADEEAYGKVGGRKFMMKKETKKAQENSSKEKKDAEEETSKNNSGASKLSHMKKKINSSGFMALNADYHMARPHPPKNN